MKYTQLGNSELKVSRICMGCMGFGDASNGQHSWTIDEAHSREIRHRHRLSERHQRTVPGPGPAGLCQAG